LQFLITYLGFVSIKVSYKKLQCDAENACGNRLCKFGSTDYGRSLLHRAANDGNLEMVRVLLENGAELDQQGKSAKYSHPETN